MDILKLLTMIIAIIAILLGTACTKKTNLTGTNWSDVYAQSFSDSTAITNGYSFPADKPVKVSGNEATILAGTWDGSEAVSLLRFSGLPDSSALTNYVIQDVFVDLNILRRDAIANNDIVLKLYKVNTGWTANPDSLSATDYTLIPGASVTVAGVVSASGDTVHVPIPAETIKTWYQGTDKNGLNILVKAEVSGSAFVEMRAATTTNGSKLRYKYKTSSTVSTFSDFSTYASLDIHGFIGSTSANIDNGVWKICNYRPSRIYVKIEPNMARFKDMEGQSLDAINLKRVNINKAELVLYIKDFTTKQNAISYTLSPLLVKTEPAGIDSIITDNMEVAQYTVSSYVSATADSAVIDITPIIQAYTAGKTTPKGIVIMSEKEHKDFGELEFFHFIGSPVEKQPYIRVKYTPPYL